VTRHGVTRRHEDREEHKDLKKQPVVIFMIFVAVVPERQAVARRVREVRAS
jgi:hypothetical protein